MAQKEIVLTKAEKLLVEWAHNDYNAAQQNNKNIMQARLNAVAETHGVPEGSQVQFIKSDDGRNITLVFEDFVNEEPGKVAGSIPLALEEVLPGNAEDDGN